MFDKIGQARLGELHFKSDEATQLKAIIAIHNTRLGPALGGCRFIEYASDAAAIDDVIRLARGMSYKAALAGLPQGGGKAVIIKPPQVQDRGALFRAFGQFVQSLGGRYITAVDSGSTLDDMEQISTVTPYVSGSRSDGHDPSPMTALGVLAGMKAAALHRFGSADLTGRTVAIQGVGQVGFALAGLLHQAGARVRVADVDEARTRLARQTFGTEIVPVEEFFATPCDILSPCGLGAVLNDETLAQLDCPVIAGSANNQLAEPRHGQALHARGILYAPDYVINAGGLITVSLGHLGHSAHSIQSRTLAIGETLGQIFARSQSGNVPPSVVADQMAEHILYPSDPYPS